MAGENYSEAILGQFFTVPSWAEKAYVVFDWYMLSQDDPDVAYDILFVGLYDPNNNAIWEYDVDNTRTQGDWRTKTSSSYSVSGLRGQELDIAFGAFTDSSFPTAWWVDNVRVYFTCGSANTSSDDGEMQTDGATVSGGLKQSMDDTYRALRPNGSAGIWREPSTHE